MTGPSFPPGGGDPYHGDPYRGGPDDFGRPRRTPGEHDPVELGALALGLLDPDRARAVEQHLATCASCRRDLEDLTAVTNLLGEVPPEALLEGPPDGDLVLQRTLRQMRSESAAQRRHRLLPRLAAVAAGVAVLVGGGVAVGRVTAPQPPAVIAAPPPAGGGASSVTDTVTLRGQGVPGVSMTAVVTPAAGWVRVSAAVRGIPPGERCRVVVLARDGSRQVAASWLTTAKGQADGIQIDGAAIVAPDQVAAVVVENEAGKQFVSLGA